MNIFYTLSVDALKLLNIRVDSCRNFNCFCDLFALNVDSKVETGESIIESSFIVENTVVEAVDVSNRTALCEAGLTIGSGFLSRLPK